MMDSLSAPAMTLLSNIRSFFSVSCICRAGSFWQRGNATSSNARLIDELSALTVMCRCSVLELALLVRPELPGELKGGAGGAGADWMGCWTICCFWLGGREDEGCAVGICW